MGDRPATVSYKWTARDQLVAQGDVSAGKYVTPYRLLPTSVEGAKALASGATVPIVLAKSSESWAVTRFHPNNKDFDWEKIPHEVSGYSTIGELCAKLYAHNKEKYVASYYDFSKKSESAKNDVALLLFDYWGNTEYRWELVHGGGFSWSTLAKDALTLPVEKNGKKLTYVIVKRPLQISVSAAPGSQIKAPADPGLEIITPDIIELESKAQRIKALLAKAEVVMKRRVMLQMGMTALKELFKASSTSNGDVTIEAALLASKAEALEPKIKEAMQKKPILELLSTKEERLPNEVVESLRKALGYTDDIAAEIKKLSGELLDMLIRDKEVASRCEAWATYVLSNNLQRTPMYASKCDWLIGAVTSAMDILAETQSGDDIAQTLWQILEKRPSEPAKSKADIPSGAETALGVLFSLLGSGPKASLTFVGNLAGPPSLSIATIQAAAAWSLTRVASDAAKGNKSGLDLWAARIFAAIEPTLGDDKVLQGKIRAAMAARNEQALFDLRYDFMKHVGDRHQTSVGWKSATVLLQFLALAISISSAYEKSLNEPVRLHDYLDIGLQGGSFVAGSVEAVLTAIGAMGKAEKGLAIVGTTIGRVSAVLGLIMGLIQWGEVGQRDALGHFAAMTAVFGNFFLLMGILPFIPVPGLQQLGLVLLAANVLLTIAIQIRDSETFHPLGTNLVASSVLAAMQSNPFYDVLKSDKDIGPTLVEIAKGCKTGMLPYAENSLFNIVALERAGFTKKEIAMIVNTTAAPPFANIEKLLIHPSP